MIITSGDLDRLTVKQLLQIAPYYNLKLTGREKKDELIEMMLEVLNQPIDDQPDQTMSVRVRRIKESSNG